MKKKHTKTNTKKLGTMDLILIIVGFLLISFTIVMILLFKLYGSTPDTLITCVFAALASECGIMGWIKTTKERRKEREWQLEDEERHKNEESDIKE